MPLLMQPRDPVAPAATGHSRSCLSPRSPRRADPAARPSLCCSLDCAFQTPDLALVLVGLRKVLVSPEQATYQTQSLSQTVLYLMSHRHPQLGVQFLDTSLGHWSLLCLISLFPLLIF